MHRSYKQAIYEVLPSRPKALVIVLAAEQIFVYCVFYYHCVSQVYSAHPQSLKNNQRSQASQIIEIKLRKIAEAQLGLRKQQAGCLKGALIAYVLLAHFHSKQDCAACHLHSFLIQFKAMHTHLQVNPTDFESTYYSGVCLVLQYNVTIQHV